MAGQSASHLERPGTRRQEAAAHEGDATNRARPSDSTLLVSAATLAPARRASGSAAHTTTVARGSQTAARRSRPARVLYRGVARCTALTRADPRHPPAPRQERPVSARTRRPEQQEKGAVPDAGASSLFKKTTNLHHI